VEAHIQNVEISKERAERLERLKKKLERLGQDLTPVQQQQQASGSTLESHLRTATKHYASGSVKESSLGRELECCSRCRRVEYCNVDCQRQHWSVHRHECKMSNNKKESTSEEEAIEVAD